MTEEHAPLCQEIRQTVTFSKASAHVCGGEVPEPPNPAQLRQDGAAGSAQLHPPNFTTWLFSSS